MMAKRSVYHVTSKNNKWQVKGEGAERAASTHKRKSEAKNEARRLAKKREPSQVVIHGEDGKIQREWTYGNDPEKYKG